MERRDKRLQFSQWFCKSVTHKGKWFFSAGYKDDWISRHGKLNVKTRSMVEGCVFGALDWDWLRFGGSLWVVCVLHTICYSALLTLSPHRHGPVTGCLCCGCCCVTYEHRHRNDKTTRSGKIMITRKSRFQKLGNPVLHLNTSASVHLPSQS